MQAPEIAYPENNLDILMELVMSLLMRTPSKKMKVVSWSQLPAPVEIVLNLVIRMIKQIILLY